MINTAKQVLQIEADALAVLKDRIDAQFIKAVQMILELAHLVWHRHWLWGMLWRLLCSTKGALRLKTLLCFIREDPSARNCCCGLRI